MSEDFFKVVNTDGTQLIDVPIKYFSLSKREYFAAMAMQAILGCSKGTRMETFLDNVKLTVAEFAVEHADALIAELEKHSESEVK